MKKFLLVFALLFAYLGVAFAAAPTAPTLYNNTDVSAVYSANIYNSGNTATNGNRDSLVGADSIFLLVKYPVDPRFQYVLQTWDSGGVADTLKYEIQYFSGDGKFKGASTLIDSAAGTAPAAGIRRLKAIDLAVNQTSWPGYITVLVKKPVATLVEKIFRVELLQRRPRATSTLVGN